jgi:phosphoadenosine phosphosulfate reductase
LVRFIKKNYPDVAFDRKHDKNGKPVTMWSLIVQNAIPPSRLARFCCKALKESDGVDRYTVTGVRAEESTNRKANQGVITLPNAGKKLKEKLNEASIKYTESKRGGVILNYDNDSERRLTEFCNRTSKRLLNPIIDWSEEDVWEFLNRNGIEHCCLYDEGFTRIGCIGCPMGRPVRQKRDFERWPQYKKLYLNSFAKMIEERTRKGLPTEKWRTPEEVMEWWLTDDRNSEG